MLIIHPLGGLGGFAFLLAVAFTIVYGQRGRRGVVGFMFFCLAAAFVGSSWMHVGSDAQPLFAIALACTALPAAICIVIRTGGRQPAGRWSPASYHRRAGARRRGGDASRVP